MKAQHHPELFAGRAAGPVSIYRRGTDGVLRLAEIKPAGTLETAKIEARELSSKPGRKPKPDPNKFAESENDY